MRITEMDTLFAYNAWANARVLDAAAAINVEDFTRSDIVPLPHGSLRATLVHALNLERSVRIRLSRQRRTDSLHQTAFATIDELTAYWRAESTAMKDYLSGLEDEHLDSDYSISDSERIPYWQLLMHVINHSTQHRSEAAVLLSALGRSPGELDLYLFLKEIGP